MSFPMQDLGVHVWVFGCNPWMTLYFGSSICLCIWALFSDFLLKLARWGSVLSKEVFGERAMTFVGPRVNARAVHSSQKAYLVYLSSLLSSTRLSSSITGKTSSPRDQCKILKIPELSSKALMKKRHTITGLKYQTENWVGVTFLIF